MSPSDDEQGRRQEPEHAGAQLRAYPRYPAMWRAKLRCKDWVAAEKVATHNVSARGMFLATTAAVQFGSRVELTLELPDSQPAVIRGTVRHVVTAEEAKRTNGTPGVGIAIGDESHEAMQLLVETARQRQEEGESSHRSDTATSLRAVKQRRSPTSLHDRDAAPIVGFDFGVSYCGASVAIGDVVEMIPDGQGRTLFPSLVARLEDASQVVGWAAREIQETRPDRVIASSKRLLGYKISDPEIGGYLQSAPFRTVAGPDDAILFEVADTRLAVPQVCALLLGHLQRTAEEHLGTAPEKVVLNVPVGFRAAQRESLLHAAKIANLEIAALIDEPLAAALAYGCGQEKNEIIGVYDFGGGTFDFTVLDMSRDQYRVLVADGNPWLGGDDFDLAMADAVANAFWRRTQVELRNQLVERQRLLIACEKAKRLLSEREQAEVRVPQIVAGLQPMDLIQSIDRAAFQRVCNALFVQSLDVCRRALDRLQLEPRDLTTLVVTGGTSQVPFVRAGLEEFFERKVEDLISPDRAIALGAGLHAGRLAGRANVRARSLA